SPSATGSEATDWVTRGVEAMTTGGVGTTGDTLVGAVGDAVRLLLGAAGASSSGCTAGTMKKGSSSATGSA
ncbi:MAG: hypothetical protein ACKOD2_00535, partial [Ilumatobacteraceae bacterium]